MASKKTLKRKLQRQRQKQREFERQLSLCRKRGKWRFATAQAADIVARQWSLREQVKNLSRVRSWRPYECACGWWHLTSAVKNTRK